MSRDVEQATYVHGEIEIDKVFLNYYEEQQDLRIIHIICFKSSDCTRLRDMYV